MYLNNCMNDECNIKIFQVKGVTNCLSEAEKSGLLCRQEPLGFDRHGRKYWFLVRRIVVYVFVCFLYVDYLVSSTI